MSKDMPMERSIAVADLSRLLGSHRPNPLMILDVRRSVDREADPRRIPGSNWYNPEHPADWISQLPRDTDLVVYCVRGHHVSNGIVDQLQSLGYQARLIEGGIEAWAAAGGKTEAVPA